MRVRSFPGVVVTIEPRITWSLARVVNMNGSSHPSAAQSPLAGLPTVLACSGCSIAGELADHTAHRLQELGVAKMSCLAGVGGRVKSILSVIRQAPVVLMIDGCPLQCGANSLRLAGFSDFQHLQLHELGVRKNTGEMSEEMVQALADAGAILLAGTRD